MNKTMMIKSKFSNAVHTLLNPNPVRNSEKWKQPQVKLTDAQKVALFDQIVKLDQQISWELGNYHYKRREKRRIQKERIARGRFPKKKTTKAQYEAMSKTNN